MATRLALRSVAALALLCAGAAYARGHEDVRVPCAGLAALTFEGNTTVTSATEVTSGTLVTPANQTLTNLPAFCRVEGLSKPTGDSSIFFEVWLPATTWNGKFLSSGEGGYAGVPNYTRLGLDGGLDELLRRGYATASTDTGHSSADPWWAIGHPEKVVDYLYRSKHLVTVAAKGLVRAYYGKPATHSYFNSCSNGGRQALMEIQRFPDDYDGYVVGAPWNFQSHSNAGFVWNAQAVNAAAIPAAKLPAITAAALAACDGNDGLVDGVISDPTRCRFDPAVLLCTGAETNSCLTAAQLATLEKIYQGPRNPRTGEKIFPGFMLGGEAGWAGIVGNANVGASGLGTGYFANITFQSRTWDYRTFNFDTDMAYADLHVGILGNAVDPDLSAAKKRGIKIIQYHGWNDQTLQPEYSPEYYETVAQQMGGLHKIRSFYRLFMIPGMTHCYFGPGATSFGAVGQQIPPARDALHDVQTALERWVENGEAPNRMVATKYTDDAAATRSIKLQRPLCAWPSSPHYKGSGDANDARSFVCKTPKGRVVDD